MDTRILELKIGPNLKAVLFAVLIIVAYAIHQVTVGGDGAILAGMIGAICGVGGYLLGKENAKAGRP